MRTFASNVAIYLRDRDFDGIDLDWEWPGEMYKIRLTELLRKVNETILLCLKSH